MQHFVQQRSFGLFVPTATRFDERGVWRVGVRSVLCSRCWGHLCKDVLQCWGTASPPPYAAMHANVPYRCKRVRTAPLPTALTGRPIERPRSLKRTRAAARPCACARGSRPRWRRPPGRGRRGRPPRAASSSPLFFHGVIPSSSCAQILTRSRRPRSRSCSYPPKDAPCAFSTPDPLQRTCERATQPARSPRPEVVFRGTDRASAMVGLRFQCVSGSASAMYYVRCFPLPSAA